MKTIQMTEEEEQLFLEWLTARETALLSQLHLLRTLRQKMTVVVSEVKPDAPAETEEETSWVEKIEAIFKDHKKPLTSGDIINRVMKKYEPLANKGRKYVTKAITSKLWVMQERGDVTKEVVNGKNVYTYRK